MRNVTSLRREGVDDEPPVALPAVVEPEPSSPPPPRWTRKRARTLLFAVGPLVVLAGALVWVTQRPYFVLKGITVGGDVGRTSVATIRANVAQRLMGNFFTIDLQSAQAAFETVPWVRHAARRLLPCLP